MTNLTKTLEKKIKCPVLVISGVDDHIFTMEDALEYLHILGSEKCDFIGLEGAGHVPVSDKPMEIQSAILKFL